MIPLPEEPSVPRALRTRLERVAAATASHPPRDLHHILRTDLGVDVATRFAGLEIPHPFGKGSGQLSCTAAQVLDDASAGLAFVVLKTVIAEDASGARTMGAWATSHTKMQVERRAGRTGRLGWTVTWQGRGWPGSLAQYAAFLGQALETGRERGMPVVPSVKFHLPISGEPWRAEEYRHTTGALLGAWQRAGLRLPMLLEKDFSPTLAGDDRSRDRETILSWLEGVPRLVHAAAPGRVALGVKVMNAVFDDGFQARMLERLARRAAPPPAWLTVFNRLFDAGRGVAYGGWDLSDRNLRVLRLARESAIPLPPLSATGNICSGRMMVEYALMGCENGQIHTFFQLPNTEYTATAGPRSARALHTLFLHPRSGLVPWLWHLAETGVVERHGGAVRFRDVVRIGRG